MRYTITRSFEFDAGHRVLEHKSKCRHLHGHRYKALITMTAPGLDKMGMVMDFGDVKEIIGAWIDDNWDHNLILNTEDPILTEVCSPTPKGYQSKAYRALFEKSPYVLSKTNPTAENMARELYEKIHIRIPSPITILKVRLYETPNCYADFEP